MSTMRMTTCLAVTSWDGKQLATDGPHKEDYMTNEEKRIEIIRKRARIGWPEATIARFHGWDVKWVRMIMQTRGINIHSKKRK